MRRRYALLGAGGGALVSLAVVLPLVFTGGSLPQLDTGPLGGGPVSGLGCVPGHILSEGMDELQNPTRSPIRIEKFTLIDARGLRLFGGVSLVPQHGPLIGLGFPYPPDHASSTLPAAISVATWDSRRTLPMTMAPGKQRWNLVFGLERTAKTGTLGDDELLYEYQGVQYLWTSRIAVKVVPNSCV